eukprot:Gb_36551 [translate_table: standard]
MNTTLGSIPCSTSLCASLLNANISGITRAPTKRGYKHSSTGGLLHNEFFEASNFNKLSGAMREKYPHSMAHTQMNCTFLLLKKAKRWDSLDKGQRISFIFRLVPMEPLGSSCHQYYRKVVTTGQYPQNVDLPPVLPKNKKKPFPVPVKELRRAARMKQKKSDGGPKRPFGPPRNGLLVPELIPIAHQVFEARISLINGLSELLKVVPAHACRHCSEVHVGVVGHPFKTCQGPNYGARKSLHEWTKCHIDDILVPVESYHLFDRLRKRLTHEERFAVERIPAIVELCIQAGVDLPQYPTRRRVEPVFYMGKTLLDPEEDEEPNYTQETEANGKVNLYEPCQQSNTAPLSPEEIQILAEQTLQAWDTMRQGAKKLKRKYAVKVCGYCPEVHVGPSGHKARNCGAYKHQQRNGQHGWQGATLDDLIPPKYVWHVSDPYGPPLRTELRRFYGQAPAIVELCIQAGAAIPEEYKPTMRLDIVIPDSQEAKMVA